MRTQAHRRSLTLVILGIAVVLFSTAGFARIMVLLASARDNAVGVYAINFQQAVSSDTVTLYAQTDKQPETRNERAKGRCAECGVIVSVRLIGSGDTALSGAVPVSVTNGAPIAARMALTAGAELTIRMSGGSIRTINLANPAPWRPGERLILIDGKQ